MDKDTLIESGLLYGESVVKKAKLDEALARIAKLEGLLREWSNYRARGTVEGGWVELQKRTTRALYDHESTS